MKTSLRPKGSDWVVSDGDKSNLESIKAMSNNKTVDRYLEMTMRSRNNRTGEKTLFSRAAKQQGLPALGSENNETHRVSDWRKMLPQ